MYLAANYGANKISQQARIILMEHTTHNFRYIVSGNMGIELVILFTHPTNAHNQ